MSEDLKRDALSYHAEPTPGKISVELTTAAETLRDLSLAYRPAVKLPMIRTLHTATQARVI
jgi:malate dehydrogenase (oxaloacetate-decarboxylating)(NADP+)